MKHIRTCSQNGVEAFDVYYLLQEGHDYLIVVMRDLYMDAVNQCLQEAFDFADAHHVQNPEVVITYVQVVLPNQIVPRTQGSIVSGMGGMLNKLIDKVDEQVIASTIWMVNTDGFSAAMANTALRFKRKEIEGKNHKLVVKYASDWLELLKAQEEE